MSNNHQQMEIRQIDVELTGQSSEGELLVAGYVNRTGQWSQPLGREKRFIEKIEPGTFQKALVKGNDVNFLAEHDNKLLLASTKNGSLQLREDENGLYMEARISPTSWGKDYHQLISDGLLTNMSFGMQVANDKWEKRADGTYERSISDLHLAEVSVVRNPAYVQSSIQARSIDIIEEPNIKLTEEPEMEKNKEKALKELRAQLEALEAEVREVPENVEVKEVRTVEVATPETVEERENRAFEQFLQGTMSDSEYRAVVTSATPGSLAVPTTLSKFIVEKLYEVAPLFSRTRGFQPVAGNLDILRESDLGTAGFIGEMTSVTPNDFTMTKVQLNQKRVATAIQLSQNLINDSGINIIDYATNILVRRMSMMIDRNVINGTKATQFEGLLGSTAVVDGVVSASNSAISIDELQKLVLSIHPDYVDGAVFVVSRNTFNLIATLKDGFGHYFLVRDVASTGVSYTLFGQPVLINDAMPDHAAGARSVLFGNFNEGYATMIKKGLSMKRITDDTTQALQGSQLILLDGYMDGKVLNEAAFKFLRAAGTAVVYPS